MNDSLIFYLGFNLLSGILVIYAASARKVSSIIAFIATLLFTPIIGFLFVLCHPTYEEYDIKRYLKKILDKQSDNNDLDKN